MELRLAGTAAGLDRGLRVKRVLMGGGARAKSFISWSTASSSPCSSSEAAAVWQAVSQVCGVHSSVRC